MNKIDEMGQAMLDSTSMGFTMKKAGRLILKKVDMYKKGASRSGPYRCHV